MRLRALSVVTAATLAACGSSSPSTGASSTPAVERVLLISVDGLHQLDVANYVAAHPTSTLAALSNTGVTYTGARCPTPSDSFPGTLALVTGGTPRTTGVYYDDSYDRTMFAPGNTTCSGAPGAEVLYDETVDADMSQILSGGLNQAALPRALIGSACRPVFPHSFLKVNTIFEVVRAAGGVTAWSDKHYSYDLLNGPSGEGVMDLYTPEINSSVANGGTVNGVNLTASRSACDGTTNSLPLVSVTDYTTCIPTVEAYDDVKVQAIINQIDGKTADGAYPQPVPTVFGMNFQAVSVGQKLTPAGYADASGTPSAGLADALAHTDASLGRVVAELTRKNLLDSTLIIVTAKHGQSPIDKTRVAMEIATLGNVTDPLAAVNQGDPNVDSGAQGGGHLQTDDVGIVWLQSPSTTSAVVTALTNVAAAIHADSLPSGTILPSSITSDAALAAIFGDPASLTDPVAAARAPNVFIQPNAGTIYSGSSKKQAEHGGGTVDDTAVALLVSRPSIAKTTVSASVTTTQVAPTILKQLGLDPTRLQAVVKEGTAVLPGL